MSLEGKKITFGITGPLYAIKQVIPQIQNLVNEGVDIIPIMSFNYCEKINEVKEITKKVKEITSKNPVYIKNNIAEIRKSELMIIAPCAGNIISKLANGIIDSFMLETVEMHLKDEKNILLGIAAAEGLGIEAENIGRLLNMKRIFFIPFRQNNPITKPNSLMYSNNYINESIKKALKEEQIQPILL